MAGASLKQKAVLAAVLIVALIYLITRLDIFYAQSRADRNTPREAHP